MREVANYIKRKHISQRGDSDQVLKEVDGMKNGLSFEDEAVAKLSVEKSFCLLIRICFQKHKVSEIPKCASTEFGQLATFQVLSTLFYIYILFRIKYNTGFHDFSIHRATKSNFYISPYWEKAISICRNCSNNYRWCIR